MLVKARAGLSRENGSDLVDEASKLEMEDDEIVRMEDGNMARALTAENQARHGIVSTMTGNRHGVTGLKEINEVENETNKGVQISKFIGWQEREPEERI